MHRKTSRVPAWPDCLYAEMRDALGRMIECGRGPNEAEALANLERLARPETERAAVMMSAATGGVSA